ncbi:hypothetical protein EBU91_04130 [bacterium]|nr:hypothetical protein [bacterium]
MIKNKLFYTGRVVDNQDIYGLGRIRVFPDTEETIREVLKSVRRDLLDNQENPTDLIESAWYTTEDPFVFYPLLPPYLSFIPQIEELVWVTYSMLKDKQQRKEQFYIPAAKTSPFNIAFEDYEKNKVNTSQGFNIQEKAPIKSLSFSSYKPWTPSNINGIWAEAGHNAIYGQGTTDIILKPDEVLIRAGKTAYMLPNSQPGQEDKRNLNRGFLQISHYTTKSNSLSPESSSSTVIDEQPLKFLIEYELENPENVVDAYTGNIYLYEVSAAAIKNNVFSSDTEIPPGKSSQYWSYRFVAQPMSVVTSLINNTINGLNEGKIDISGTDTYSASTLVLCDDVDANGNCGYCGRCFPFYYRPKKSMRKILASTPNYSEDPSSYAKLYSVSVMVVQIKFTRAFNDVNGDGLVSKKNKFGPSTKTVTKQSIPTTIYGINQKDILETMIPNTDGMVRGEKLKEFLSLLMKFTLTHCHPYHGTPPTPVSFSEVDISQIEQEFQTFDDKVLNKNIRIN